MPRLPSSDDLMATPVPSPPKSKKKRKKTTSVASTTITPVSSTRQSKRFSNVPRKIFANESDVDEDGNLKSDKSPANTSRPRGRRGKKSSPQNMNDR